MGLSIVIVGVALILFAGMFANARSASRRFAAPSYPTSPLAEAERILALRRAKGQITAEEHERMLTVLHR